MASLGFAPRSGFRLARMPLRSSTGPILRDLQYWAGRDADGPDGTRRDRWTTNAAAAADLFTHDGYTSVCTAWLPDPRRWLLLYSEAHDGNPDAFAKSAHARIAATPMEWAEPGSRIEIFNPTEAYGRYMHKPGKDDIGTRVRPFNDHQGWAYGLHLLDKYTRWDENTRELDIYYLLSLSVPYQVQLMHTRLRITVDAGSQSARAWALAVSAANLSAAGDTAGAAVAARESVALFTALYPDVDDVQRSTMALQVLSTAAFLPSAEAIAAIQDAVRVFRDLHDAQPDDPTHRSNLAWSLAVLASRQGDNHDR